MGTSNQQLKRFYLISVPNLIASLSTPILSIVNVAMVGMLGEAALIAGVSLGTQMIDTMYWLFGSLRFVASGCSAQSLGSGDRKQRFASLVQPLMLALLIFVLIYLFQKPLFHFFVWFIRPEASVIDASAIYYDIMIYACFFVLADFIIRGWLMGQKKTFVVMVIKIAGALLNIALDYVGVVMLGLGVAGVAYATLVSQGITFFVEVIYLLACCKFKKEDIDRKMLFDKTGTLFFLKCNSDVFIRTACQSVSKNVLTRFASQFGTVALASNSIVLQMSFLVMYATEALGNSTCIFAGEAWGRKDKKDFVWAYRAGTYSSIALGAVLAILLYVLAPVLFPMFTNSPEVLAYIVDYKIWLFITPICAILIEPVVGVLSGCTHTSPIRNAALLALFLSIVSMIWLTPVIGNQGVWVGQCVYYSIYGLMLWIGLKIFIKKSLTA